MGKQALRQNAGEQLGMPPVTESMTSHRQQFRVAHDAALAGSPLPRAANGGKATYDGVRSAQLALLEQEHKLQVAQLQLQQKQAQQEAQQQSQHEHQPPLKQRIQAPPSDEAGAYAAATSRASVRSIWTEIPGWIMQYTTGSPASETRDSSDLKLRLRTETGADPPPRSKTLQAAYERMKSNPRWLTMVAIVLALLLTWLFIDTESYPLYWVNWVIRGKADVVDPSFTHNCAAPPSRESARLVVVIPLTAPQTPRLLRALQLWQERDVMPACSDMYFGNASYPNAVAPDLLIWFDRPLHHPKVRKHYQELRTLLLEDQGPGAMGYDSSQSLALTRSTLRSCFNTVQIKSANLPDAQARNSFARNWFNSMLYTEGSNGQFYRLFDKEAESQHDYMFVMEPDTIPVRPHWLDAIHSAAVNGGDFWVKGSIMRYQPKFNIAFEPFRRSFTNHINGNALYRLREPCFRAFLDAARSEGDCEGMAYDVCMSHFRHSYSRINLHHATAHRFVYTDVVVNLSGEKFELSEALEELPNTYVIHGKNVRVNGVPVLSNR